MSTTTVATLAAVEPGCSEWAQPVVPVRASRWQLASTRSAYLSQRGMVTAEYAVGILGAMAFALVLLNIFRSSEFITQITKYVGQLIGHMSKQIK